MEINYQFTILCGFFAFVIFAIICLVCIVGTFVYALHTGHVPHFKGKADIDAKNKKASVETEIKE